MKVKILLQLKVIEEPFSPIRNWVVSIVDIFVSFNQRVAFLGLGNIVYVDFGMKYRCESWSH